MTTLTLPQIKWGKRKERSQMCEVFTEDGRLVELELDVLHGCLQNSNLETQDAHIISAENQFYDEDDGIWKQQINELSACPICMIKPGAISDPKKKATEIWRNSRVSAKLKLNKEALKSTTMERLTIIVSIVCGTFLIIAAMQHFGG